MNDDIQKYEERKRKKLWKDNPQKFKKDIQEHRQKERVWWYSAVIVMILALLNSFFSGPPILYILFLIIPWTLKVLFTKNY